jgi:parallel beta-helix repeat protein
MRNQLIKIQSITLLFLFVSTTFSYSRIIVVDHRIPVEKSAYYNFVTRRPDLNETVVFKTIQAAVDFAGFGDTVVVRQGYYNETVNIEKDGITLMGFNNEEVIIDGNNPRLGPLIRIEGSNIKINGLSVRHSSRFGIYAENSNNIVIQNCEVAYSEDGGIVFNGSRYVLIDNCRVHHNNYKGLAAAHEGITIRNTKYFEVRNCEVFDNKEEGIDAKYGSEFGKIHNNVLYRNNGPQIYIDKANNIEVFNNIVYDVAGEKAGISINIESTYHPEGTKWTLHNIKVYNNLVYNNSGGIGFWLEYGRNAAEEAHWDSIYIFNNTLVNNSRPNSSRGGGIYISNGERHNFGDHIYIVNNIIWEKTNSVSRCIRDDAGVIDKFNIRHNVFPSGEPTDAKGEYPVLAPEIQFIDPHNHDFRLVGTSPLINRGFESKLSLTYLMGPGGFHWSRD